MSMKPVQNFFKNNSRLAAKWIDRRTDFTILEGLTRERSVAYQARREEDTYSNEGALGVGNGR